MELAMSSFSKKKQKQNTYSKNDIDFRPMMEPVVIDFLGPPNPMRGQGVRLKDARGYSTSKEFRWGDSGRIKVAKPGKRGYGNYSRYPSEPNHHTVLEFLEHEVGIKGWNKQSEHLVKLGLLAEDMLPNRKNGGAGRTNGAKAPEIDPTPHDDPDVVEDGALDEDGVAEESDEARLLTDSDIPYDYVDEQRTLLFRVVRHKPKAFSQRRPRPGVPDSWISNIDGVRRVIFRLPEVIQANDVVIVEGERDVLTVEKVGLVATTAPGGAGGWLPEFNEFLRGKNVVLVPDCNMPDSKSKLGIGRDHMHKVAANIKGVAKRIRWLDLAEVWPECPDKGDISKYVATGNNGDPVTKQQLRSLLESAKDYVKIEPEGVGLEDFYALMEQHEYIFVPTRGMWPTVSVNARIPYQQKIGKDGIPILNDKGKPVMIPPSLWLDQNRPVEGMTWFPGEPLVLKDTLITNGGKVYRKGVSTFNLYRPPTLVHGNMDDLSMWTDLVKFVWGEYAEHVTLWFTHRVQFPQVKINHAFVLGGSVGIGKDTMMEPLKRAVGPWNFGERVRTKYLVASTSFKGTLFFVSMKAVTWVSSTVMHFTNI
jgi:hypothetical protein